LAQSRLANRPDAYLATGTEPPTGVATGTEPAAGPAVKAATSSTRETNASPITSTPGESGSTFATDSATGTAAEACA
jgi:hypothetical protein